LQAPQSAVTDVAPGRFRPLVPSGTGVSRIVVALVAVRVSIDAAFDDR